MVQPQRHTLSSPPDRPPPQPHGLWRLLPRENLSASVYGTILVSSVIVGLAGTDLTAGAMMAALAVTALVFALAHAWSGALARSADDRQALSVGHVLDGIRHEWPMVEAVTPALLALGLAALEVYSESTGLWIAIIANTVLLFAWGAILRHRAAGNALQFIGAGLDDRDVGPCARGAEGVRSLTRHSRPRGQGRMIAVTVALLSQMFRAAAATRPPADPDKTLRDLTELHERGIVSDAGFEALRTRLRV